MKASIKIWIENSIASLNSVSESPRLDAELLASHVIGKDRSWLLAHPDQTLTLEQLSTADELLLKEVSGTPLPYLLGHWEFFSLDFTITPDVLIPRPETELLVEKALQWLAAYPNKTHIADIGTGSGCIAVAIAKNHPGNKVIATDNSENALAVARLNVDKYNLNQQVKLIRTNLLDGLDSTFDLICANLPYIPNSRLDQLAVSKAEPISALDGGADGVELITEFLMQAKESLAPGGCILAEIDYTQSQQLTVFAKTLFPDKRIVVLPDLAKLPRLLMIR